MVMQPSSEITPCNILPNHQLAFSPTQTPDLYHLDRMVTSISTGSSQGLEELQSFMEGVAGAGTAQQHDCYEEDYYEGHWDGEEDGGWDEHGWCDGDGGFDARSLGRAASGLRSGSISRTPGRRPPQRSLNRPGSGKAAAASAGSGGNGTGSSRGSQRRGVR
jgi:hypothetical protein